MFIRCICSGDIYQICHFLNLLSSNHGDLSIHNNLFHRLPSYENLTVHHFCHTKKGSTLFNDVIKKRLRWWKRFSNKQTNFSHQVMESKNNEMLAVAEVVVNFISYC